MQYICHIEWNIQPVDGFVAVCLVLIIDVYGGAQYDVTLCQMRLCNTDVVQI